MRYTSNLKQSKEINFAKNTIYNLAVSLFFTLLVAVVVINVFNLRLDEVLTPSMTPAINTTDIVVVHKQDSYEIGDVIEYRRKGDTKNVTHRIVALGDAPNTFVPQGDANNAADAQVSIDEINGKVIAVWRNGRTVYHTIENSYFVIITLLIGAWVLSSTVSGEIEMKKHNILNI